MHRHGYKGRKFGRERDQREALIAQLATSLIQNGSMTTTISKAKEIRPVVEKMVTKAKKGTLHARRQLIADLDNNDKVVAHLMDIVVPATKDRTSGYLRIQKTDLRKGDNAQMATISFVDNFTVEEKK